MQKPLAKSYDINVLKLQTLQKYSCYEEMYVLTSLLLNCVPFMIHSMVCCSDQEEYTKSCVGLFSWGFRDAASLGIDV